MRDNDVDLLSDKFGRDLDVAITASFRPTIVDRDRATVDSAEFSQSLYKGSCPRIPT
jgi:hypothetical protein